MDIERYKQRLLELERKLSFQVGHELANARETRDDQPGHGDRAMVVIVIVSLLKSFTRENRRTCTWARPVAPAGGAARSASTNRCAPSAPSRSGCKPGTARGDFVGQWVEALPGLRY
jgi:hypothetical protein